MDRLDDHRLVLLQRLSHGVCHTSVNAGGKLLVTSSDWAETGRDSLRLRQPHRILLPILFLLATHRHAGTTSRVDIAVRSPNVIDVNCSRSDPLCGGKRGWHKHRPAAIAEPQNEVLWLQYYFNCIVSLSTASGLSGFRCRPHLNQPAAARASAASCSGVPPDTPSAPISVPSLPNSGRPPPIRSSPPAWM